MIATTRFELSTKGQGDVRDISGEVREFVERSAARAGMVTVFVVGSTAGVTTIEFESGVISDLGEVLERVAPRAGPYQHHLRWGDDNGSSHVRAALVGPSLTVPFVDGTLTLGTWQQIVLLEFDTSPRRREVVLQVIGE